ncbi:Putrescine-binding periplasmic protein [Bosea sp. LC85]|uniref:polyamine ABC transporter substrate-binding protein n=1 Tax=Bosea sp. LC85 TaxID=1502851 RepID=UPI0004E34FF0|nr:polyamine ABC transporter substrate-binding protein [Bosea sp. LC85]KFC64082.1 Putrescine-binding periplasmic protein [Bosea sp. LC85]
MGSSVRGLKGLATAIALGWALVSGTAASAQDKQLRIFNWSDYVDPEVLDAFKKETGITVVYDTFDQMETVETKLLAGKTGYDLIVVTASFLPRHIPLNLYRPIDAAAVPNLKNAWLEIQQRLAKYDPGNTFAVNYMWGTTGIGYNVAKIKERLGPDAVIDSWRILFEPDQLKKLSNCGVHVLDAVEEMFPAALRYLGLNPDSKNEADLNKAGELLRKIRPHIQKFHSSEYINALANGDICLAVGYSGDILQAKKRAEEAKNKVEIAYSIPKEGALMWFDSFVIPKDAANPDAALKFIDFVNRPEMAAKNSDFIQYANGNIASKPLLSAAVRDNPGIYPSEAVMSRLYTITPYDQKSQKVVNRLWTRIKTGK